MTAEAQTQYADMLGHPIDVEGKQVAYGPDERGVFGVYVNSRTDALLEALRSLHPPRVHLEFVLPGWLEIDFGLTRSQWLRRAFYTLPGRAHAQTHIGPAYVNVQVTWPIRAVEHCYPPGVTEEPF